MNSFLIFQPILTILVSKFMVYRAFSDQTYILLGLRSPLKKQKFENNGNIHVYSYRAGADLLGYFFQKYRYSVNLLQVFPI